MQRTESSPTIMRSTRMAREQLECAYTQWISSQSLTGVAGNYPDSKVHGAYMGPTWGQQDPDGPHDPCYLGRLFAG